MESRLQSKRLGWLGHTVRTSNIRLLKKLYLMKSCVFVNQALYGCTRQAALERQDLSCTYLAHHVPKSGKEVVISVISAISTGILDQTAPTFAASHFEQCEDRNHKAFACCICVKFFISSVAALLNYHSDVKTYVSAGVSLVAIAMGLNLLELLPFRLPSLDVDVRTLQVPPLLQVGPSMLLLPQEQQQLHWCLSTPQIWLCSGILGFLTAYCHLTDPSNDCVCTLPSKQTTL